jgi:hypothetical protein
MQLEIRYLDEFNEYQFDTSICEGRPKNVYYMKGGVKEAWDDWVKAGYPTACLKINAYFESVDQSTGLELMLIILGLPPVKSAPLGPCLPCDTSKSFNKGLCCNFVGHSTKIVVKGWTSSHRFPWVNPRESML